MVSVRLQFIVRDTDRHGNVRVYFRRRGHRKVRILEPIGSAEFLAAYNRLLAETGSGQRKRVEPLGTLKWLCQEYFKSSIFRQLDERTQHVRQLVLESVWAEATAPGSELAFGVVSYQHINPKAVRVLRDRKLDAPESANARVKALRQVFAWALSEEVDGIDRNPAREVTYLKGKPGGFHSWTVEEVELFEAKHAVGSKARLAMALLLYTGQRRSDVILFGKQHVRGGWLKFTQQKNRRRKPVTLEIPVLAPLQRIIDATPSAGLTFLESDRGQPFSEAGFGNKFRQWCDEAGLKHCSAHGLRKAGASIAATNGATPHQLMSVFGWLSLKQAELYTRAARQKQLAGGAMKLLLRDKDET